MSVREKQHLNFTLWQLYVYLAEPNIFLLICTHTQTIIISSDLCPHMSTMLFKLRPCIPKLCNVYYPPTPSLGWIGQIKGCSLSLASQYRTHATHICPPQTHGHGHPIQGSSTWDWQHNTCPSPLCCLLNPTSSC